VALNITTILICIIILNINSQRISKWLKSNYKGLMIVTILAIASLIINAYIGFGPKQQQQPLLAPSTSSIIERNIQSNPKAGPFAMRSSFILKIMMDNKPFTILSQIGIEEPL
jgi:hypothetical protein